MGGAAVHENRQVAQKDIGSKRDGKRGQSKGKMASPAALLSSEACQIRHDRLTGKPITRR